MGSSLYSRDEQWEGELAEMDAMDADGAVFAHACFPRIGSELISGLQALVSTPWERDVRVNVFPGFVQSQYELCVYLVTIEPSKSVVWIPEDWLSLVPALAGVLDCHADWISVYEAMRIWAYIRFEGRQSVYEVLDPLRVWTMNLFSRGELVGEGDREHASLDAFLDRIETWYQPIDQVWNYPRWHDEGLRRETVNFYRPLIRECQLVRMRPHAVEVHQIRCS